MSIPEPNCTKLSAKISFKHEIEVQFVLENNVSLNSGLIRATQLEHDSRYALELLDLNEA